MKKKLLTMLITVVLEMLNEKTIKDFADNILDYIEDKVLASGSKWDDKIVLPICEKVREAFNISDDD